MFKKKWRFLQVLSRHQTAGDLFEKLFNVKIEHFRLEIAYWIVSIFFFYIIYRSGLEAPYARQYLHTKLIDTKDDDVYWRKSAISGKLKDAGFVQLSTT